MLHLFILPLSFNYRRYRLADTFKLWAPKAEVLIPLMETQESSFSCRFGNFCKKAVLLKDEVIFDLQLRRHLNLFSRLGALTGGLESTSAHVDPIGRSWTPPRTPPGWNRDGSTKDSDGLYGGPTRLLLSLVDFRNLILVDSIPQVRLTPFGLDSTGLRGESALNWKSDGSASDFFKSPADSAVRNGLHRGFRHGLWRSWVHMESTKYKSPPRSPLEF